jgi:hypothetical protein
MSHRTMKGKEPWLGLSATSVESLLERLIGKLAAAYPELCGGLDMDGLPAQLAHVEVRGCLFDPSRNAADAVELRLQAARLCPECRSRLESAGVTPERLQQIVEALRLLAAPSRVVH